MFFKREREREERRGVKVRRKGDAATKGRRKKKRRLAAEGPLEEL